MHTHAKKKEHLLVNPLTILCLAFVLFLSYFTYAHRFDQPQGFFWDENYYIADAQKTLNGMFYMQNHPPLGKLLIAAGETLLDASANDRQFLETDYAKGDFTDGFTVTGYRFFPVLLAWLTAPLFFGIFLLLTRNPLSATLLSFLYIFDNALIVHSRGAMLEAPLLFFSSATILIALLFLLEGKRMKKWRFRILSILFGIALAAATTTKVLGLILMLLLFPIFLVFLPQWKEIGAFSVYASLSFAIMFVAVWQTHFAFGDIIQGKLKGEGWYGASPAYREIVQQGKQESLLSFPIMLRDSLRFSGTENGGVPRLDFSKPDENGSPFFLWPFGARAINYRWERTESGATRYLYLQANPVVWLLGLCGVIFASTVLLASLFFPLQKKMGNKLLLLTFLGLYIAYMIVIANVGRVMYLYHYFLPLLFSFILFGIVFTELRSFGRLKLTEHHKLLSLLVLSAAIFLSYQYYRPLTYFEPITNEQLAHRALFKVWGLTCAECPRENPFAVVREVPSAK